MKSEFSSTEILKDSLVSICYALNEIDENDQEVIDAIAVDMIGEGVTDIEIGMLAIFIEKLLTFYASDEAVPLLEGSLDTNSFPPAPVLPVDDCPFDVVGEATEDEDVQEPSDLELQEIESDNKGFLENLWEEPKDNSERDIDFAFGVNVVDNVDDDPEPDYSGLSRRERKRLKKARRAAKRDKNKNRRNEDYGFDNFEIYKGSKSSSVKTFKEVIHYDFDVLDKAEENDQDIGRLVNASFEEKKESYFSSKPKFQSQPSFQSSSVGTPIPGLKLPSRIQEMIDNKPSNGNPFKRSYGWPDGDDFID